MEAFLLLVKSNSCNLRFLLTKVYTWFFLHIPSVHFFKLENIKSHSQNLTYSYFPRSGLLWCMEGRTQSMVNKSFPYGNIFFKFLWRHFPSFLPPFLPPPLPFPLPFLFLLPFTISYSSVKYDEGREILCSFFTTPCFTKKSLLVLSSYFVLGYIQVYL